MKNSLVFLFTVICFLNFGQTSHSTWNELLVKYVSNDGKVDYLGFKNESVKLDKYLALLQNNGPESNWSKEEKIAYWANAYNAFTIKLILKNYPLKSITEIKINNQNAWDYKWIKIGKETMSLNDIEHNKLRGQFKDARIHFVLNCASYSCPILLNEALTSKDLEVQLENQTVKFINDPLRNSISSANIQVSQLFNWYKSDFTSNGKSLIDFINHYAKIKVSKTAKISYLEYNWKLNSK